MRLRLTVRALDDLNGICDYVHERNPAAALRVRGAIRAALRMISTYPQAGSARSASVRRLVVPRYPYLIFYGLDEAAAEVRVFTIRHSAREEEF